MTLPVPNLDDRRFQDLVDDAKRHVQARCPEWSDHNVSDPGVTLIETFAMVADQLFYRLNRVPDRLYLRFLGLLGIRLHPPAAATAPVTFWLSAPQPETVTVRADTELATERTEEHQAVAFRTADELVIPSCALVAVATGSVGPGDVVDRTEQWDADEAFPCFAERPAVGDVLLLGLSVAAPRCAVALRFRCEVEGIGVDPRQPPLVWEAWTGGGWEPCELGRDETGGLNRPGDVVVHLPAGHTRSAVAGRGAAWVRCRVVDPVPGQPFYTAPPRLRGASAFTIGGTVDAAFAETVRDEIVGVSDGVPGQRHALARGPVLAGAAPLVIEVAEGAGWAEWTQVEHFSESLPGDRHFVLDPVAGEIVFGPGIRLGDGSVRQFGAVPSKAAPIRVPCYRVGGGRRGNVARGAIRALRTAVPFVSSVENREPATGGVDGEDIEAAKLRAPLALQSRGRAVTAADYEYLAAEADPQVARARCVPGEGADAAVVRVLLIPALPTRATDDAAAAVRFEALRPSADLLRRVSAYLDERRVLGTRLLVEPPFYRGITAVARVRAEPRTEPERVDAAARATLARYLHPLHGGPDGTGWPFGRPVRSGDLFAALQSVAGVEAVEEVRLYEADPITGRRSKSWVSTVDIGPDALPFPFDNRVQVIAP